LEKNLTVFLNWIDRKATGAVQERIMDPELVPDEEGEGFISFLEATTVLSD
jgi:hypothetical protein